VEKPVVALVLLIVGVALVLAATTFAGNYLIFWRRSPAVWIERADILIHPHSNLAYITVEVRNVGGRDLMSCSARVMDPPIEIDDVTSPSIGVVGSGTFVKNGVSGLSVMETYVVEVRCVADDGSTVVDRKTAKPHL